jgi:sugar-specific transcriptional regulator TrmB
MIDNKKLHFLYEMGLEETQIKIYKYLLENKFGTIKAIKNNINAAFSTVSRHLKELEKKKLIESSSDGNSKIFIRKNPKVALTELMADSIAQLKDNIKILDEELKIQESSFGRCMRDITFYHYSDINLALNNYYELIEQAQTEIVMTTLPLLFIKKIAPSLYEAFMRGVHIKIYFSLSDFEEEVNYFEELTNILKKIRIEIIQTKQKTCQVIKYNDQIVNMGNILLDDNYLNSLIFKEDEVFHCDGFLGPPVVKQQKQYLEVLEIEKKWEIEYPEPLKRVIKVIEGSKSIKTRDLSNKSKIGGAKLKEILEYLIKEGLIKETTVKSEKTGRPGVYYSLVE